MSCNSDLGSVLRRQRKTVCDADCGVGNPVPESGQCEPWLPGRRDPKCTGADLALGIPCEDKIPVCNHGTVQAPSGLRIIHFPANSQQYPSCTPNQNHAQMQECKTDKPIPPGECVSFTCGNLGNGNREVMINPPPQAAWPNPGGGVQLPRQLDLVQRGHRLRPPPEASSPSTNFRTPNTLVHPFPISHPPTHPTICNSPLHPLPSPQRPFPPPPQSENSLSLSTADPAAAADLILSFRAITPADLSHISSAGSKPSAVTRLRANHHAIARLLAAGVKPVEISARIGITQSTISILQKSPPFLQLLADYQSEATAAAFDLRERLLLAATLSTDRLVELLSESEDLDPDFLRKTVVDLLDRTGYPGVKQVNSVSVGLSSLDIAALKEKYRHASQEDGPQNGVEEGEIVADYRSAPGVCSLIPALPAFPDAVDGDTSEGENL